ncbi:putative transposase for insertion sequence element [Oscillibacter valericigenes Sjm18-20]|nr:putative transposase for insertion sequence element [Oscillibacter valericigenes Sjm18-20]
MPGISGSALCHNQPGGLPGVQKRPESLRHCPTRHLCTHARDCVKTVQRHIWKDYEDVADDARYTPEYQALYAKRKETIERVFADAKEKHAMRYTQYRGLAQVANWVKLKFVAMNLKKLAKWKWRASLSLHAFLIFGLKHTKNPVYAAAYTGFFDRLRPWKLSVSKASWFFLFM